MGITTSNLENITIDSKLGLSTIPSFPENFLPIKVALDSSNKDRLTELNSASIGKTTAIHGNYAVIGAPTASGGGLVVVYKRNNDTWEFAYELVAPETTVAFGSSVAIWKNWVLVGDPAQKWNSFDNSGAVYSFEIGSKTYKTRTVLYPENRETSEKFGQAISLVNNIAVISRPSASQDHKEIPGSNEVLNAGLVSIFKLDRVSRSWTKISSISASGNQRNVDDKFGQSISISGNKMAVGIPGYDYDLDESSYLVNAGAVALFDFTTSWVFDRLLVSGSRTENDGFGSSVSLDGNVLAVGNSSQERRVEIIELQSTEWQTTKVVEPSVITFPAGWAEPVVTISDTGFGNSISLSQETLVIGAPNQSMPFVSSDPLETPTLTYISTTIPNVGSVYVLKKTNGSWNLIKQLVNPKLPIWGQNESIEFGTSVSIKDNLLIVGAPFDSYDVNHKNPITNSGSAFVYEIVDETVSLISPLSGWGQDRNPNDNFSHSFDVMGNILVVGAPNHSYDSESKNFSSQSGAVYIFEFENDSWNFKKKITGFGGGSRVTNEHFGSKVIVKDNKIFVNAPGASQKNSETISSVGAIFVFENVNGSWVEHSRLVPSDANAYDEFGYEFSYDSNVLVASSKSSTDSQLDNPKDQAGAVYVYRFSNDIFAYETKITPTGLNSRNANDLFGSTVKIKNNTLVVGAENHSFDFDGKNPLDHSGAAWIFQYDGSWSQIDKITGWGQEVNTGDLFGFSADGDLENLFIGIPNHGYDETSRNYLEGSGMVRWYTKNNDSWILSGKITSGLYRSEFQYFGHTISFDGSTLVIGAPGESFGSNHTDTSYGPGAAYVFEKTTSWVLKQRLIPSGVNAGNSFDESSFARFGWSLKVSGTTIVVGAPLASYNFQGMNSLKNSGAAFVFENNNGVWTQTYRMSSDILSSKRSEFEYFGYSVALNGSSIAIGAPGHTYDSDDSRMINSGATFIFQKVNDNWLPIQKITSWGQDYNPGDMFGSIVKYDNGFMFVGAPNHSYDSKSKNYLDGAGAVYVFEKVNGVWNQKQKLVPQQRFALDNFGKNIEVLDGTILISGKEKVFLWEADTQNVFSQVHVFDTEESNSGFGTSIALDLSFVYISAPSWKFDSTGINSLDNCGAVFVYSLANFELLTTIVSNSRAANQYFGKTIDIQDNILVVSSDVATLDDQNTNTSTIGNVWVFEKNSSTFTFVQKITSSGIDGSSTDLFGYSAASSSDVLVIGAPNNSYDENGEQFLNGSGAVFVYRKTNGLIFEKKLVSDERTTNEQFGSQVAVRGSKIIVSSPSYGDNKGKVWVFETSTQEVSYQRQYSTFFTTGTNQSFTVPQNVTKLRVRAIGASGGSSQDNIGGMGAYVASTLSVVPGEVLTIQVGQKGQDGRSGAGGGGRSAVLRNSDYLLVAGGGGGAGWNVAGGNAGLIGNSSYSNSVKNPGGRGGSQISGGLSGVIPPYVSETRYNGQNGSALQGGDGAQILTSTLVSGGWPNGGDGYSHHSFIAGSAGGGDGYFGGGASSYSDPNNYSSGGGGGSSFVTGSDSVVLSTFWNSYTSPYVSALNSPRKSSGFMDYQDIISGNYGYKENGLVIIEWLEERVRFDWSLVTSINPSGLNSWNANDQFGYSISLSDSYMAVGAPGNSFNNQGGNFVENAGSAYVFETTNWTQIGKINSFDNAARVNGGMFGYSVSIEESIIVVGAPRESLDSEGRDEKTGAGAVYVFEVSGQSINNLNKIVGFGNSRNASDNSGSAIAVYGNYLVVGTPGHSYNSENKKYVDGAGAVYVWKFANSSWSIIQKLTAPESSRLEKAAFGSSVAINSSAIVVGAPNADISGMQDVGQVYVFEKTDETWSLVKTIDPDSNNDFPLGMFGYSLALSEEHLVIGAPGNHGSYGGKIYCFDTTSWTENFSYGQNVNLDDRFGESISLVDNLLVVGSPLDSKDQNDRNPKTNAGSASVFSYTTSWLFVQKIVAWGHDYEPNDQLGTSISFDVSTGFMAVGAPGHSYDSMGINYVESAGTVYIWKLINGNWSIFQKISADENDRIENLNFGYNLKINGDVLAIGTSNANKVFVFENENSSWTQTAVLESVDVDPSDKFGFGLAVDSASKTIVVTSPYHSLDSVGENSLSNAGAAWVFKKNTSWVYDQKICPSGLNARNSDDNFGFSVSISGNVLFVGSPNNSWDHNGKVQMINAGAVFAFARTDENVPFVQIQKIISRGQKKNFGDAFSTAVDQNTDWLVISSPNYDYDTNQDDYKSNSGIVYVWQKVDNNYQYFTSLVSQYREAESLFGSSLSLGNNVLAVGAPSATYDSTGNNSIMGAGAVHIFRYNGTSWVPGEILTSFSQKGREEANFGSSVSINGSFLAVGAPMDSWDESDSVFLNNGGKVYVFKESNGSFVEFQALTPHSQGEWLENGMFGQRVSCAGDILVISSPNHPFYQVNSGAAWVYRLVNNVWIYEDTISTTFYQKNQGDDIGKSFSLSDSWMAIGSPGHDFDENEYYQKSNAGAVFIFKKINGVWTKSQKLAGHGFNNRNANDRFGEFVVISNGLLAVSAPGQSYDSLGGNYVESAGAVFTYRLEGSIWRPIPNGKLVAMGTNARNTNDKFGTSIAMSENNLVIGSPNHSYDSLGDNYLEKSGAAWLFRYDTLSWDFFEKLTGYGENGRNANDLFSSSMSIYGGLLAIGAPGHAYDVEGQNPVSGAGAVFTFFDQGSPSVIITGERSNDPIFNVVVNGQKSIERVEVLDGGDGFMESPEISFYPESASAYALMVSTGLSSVKLLDPGYGFTEEPIIHVVNDPLDTTGTGASVKAIFDGTSISRIEILDGGLYTRIPTLKASYGVTAHVTALEPTSISSIEVLNKGSGYLSVPQITITGNATAVANMELDQVMVNTSGVRGDVNQYFRIVGGVGTPAIIKVSSVDSNGHITGFEVYQGGLYSVTPGSSAVSIVDVSPVFRDYGLVSELATVERDYGEITGFVDTTEDYGWINASSGVTVNLRYKVSSVELTESGSNYSSVPVISTVGTNTTSAIFTANLVPSAIVSITVDNGGTGLTVLPEIDLTEYAVQEAVTKSYFSSSSIKDLVVVSSGHGYTRTPTIMVEGGEAEAVSVAILNETSIDRIVVTDGGTGYEGWSQYSKIIEPSSENIPQGEFGKNVLGDKNSLFVMSNNGFDQYGKNNENAGSVYVYSRTNSFNDSKYVILEGEEYMNISSARRDMMGSYAISFWSKSSSVSENETLLSIDKVIEGSVFENTLRVFTNEDSLIFSSKNIPNKVIRTSPDFTSGGMRDGTWKHFMISYDQNTNIISLYIDGVKQEIVLVEPNGRITNSSIITIGANVSSVGDSVEYENSYQGFIKDISAFNRTLTTNDIKFVYGLNYNPLTVSNSMIGLWIDNSTVDTDNIMGIKPPIWTTSNSTPIITLDGNSGSFDLSSVYATDFNIISGDLPSSMYLSGNTLIWSSGWPYNYSSLFTVTIRASNSIYYSDRTFTITAPVIENASQVTPTIIDISYNSFMNGYNASTAIGGLLNGSYSYASDAVINNSGGSYCSLEYNVPVMVSGLDFGYIYSTTITRTYQVSYKALNGTWVDAGSFIANKNTATLLNISLNILEPVMGIKITYKENNPYGNFYITEFHPK